MSQDARETESERRIRNTPNKPCRVELVTTAEIVIIDPKPNQGTHFLYTIKKSPMDFSRESQTSANTSEFIYLFIYLLQSMD